MGDGDASILGWNAGAHHRGVNLCTGCRMLFAKGVFGVGNRAVRERAV
jgi:hypothetical protein